MEINTEATREKSFDILKLIDRGQTDINDLVFLTQYEVNFNKILRCVTNEVNQHMTSISTIDYAITDAIIDKDGTISNFHFRAKDKMSILNEINILKYIDSILPNEIKGFYEIDPNFIYVIKFIEVKKMEVTEEESEAIIDEGGIVIIENDKYQHLTYKERLVQEKYWTENIYKAIFYLKSLGFYLGLNDPTPEVNIEILKEFSKEDFIILLKEHNIIIDKIPVNMGIIQRIKIPTNLTNLLKKKYVKRISKFQKPKNLSAIYKSETNETNLAVDHIPEEFDKIKVPRR